MKPKLAAVSLLTLAWTASMASAQTFRVDVNAVRVDVFVGNGNKAVPGLTARDFELYDNGVRQEIVRVETHTVPVNLVLALDTSHSVRGEKLDYLKIAASTMLAGLEPKDGAALVTFSSLVQSVGFADSRERLESVLAATSGFGSTSLNDGLFAALKLAERVAHPAIVVFTDGEDRFSWIAEDEAYEAATQSEASVFVVAAKQDPPRLEIANHFLKELTGMAGGDFLEARTPDRLPEIFSSILAQLKTRYVLTYLPEGAPEPGWHELRVRLRGGKGAVRARRGYYYENRQS
jgi:VWFA-related protein